MPVFRRLRHLFIFYPNRFLPNCESFIKGLGPLIAIVLGVIEQMLYYAEVELEYVFNLNICSLNIYLEMTCLV
jgi:hypothetical protein